MEYLPPAVDIVERIQRLCFILLFFCCTNIYSTTTYTVGAGGTYPTIAAAYGACTAATDYVLDIRSDYNAVAEAKPISLVQLTNKSSSNTVTIRPQAGVAGLAITGTAAQIFYFNGADYVIIDGRPGGSGASDFTISNTNTAAGMFAFQFAADATNNTIKYCTVKGAGTSVASNTGGVINFGTAAAGGNDNNTIDNCTIQKSSGGAPGIVISALGSSGNINTGIVLSNNNLVDATRYFVFIDTYNDGWTITGNNFYQSAAHAPTGAFYFIYITAGAGHSITNNYLGGQAPLCAGGAYTLNAAAQQVDLIYFATTSGTSNTVTGNTFKNITSACTGSFYGISTAATSQNFTVSLNIFQDLNLAGAFTGIDIASSGTSTVSSNTIGSAAANNISLSKLALHYGISLHNNGTYTCSGNTIQQCNLTNAGSNNAFYGIYIIGTGVSCSTNAVRNITSAGTGSFYTYGIYVYDNASAVVSFNTIHDITLSEPFIGLFVQNSGGGTVNSNTIGSSANNNISLSSGNTNNFGIYLIGSLSSSSFTVNSNVVQEVSSTSTGDIFFGINHSTGTISMDRDTVRNIDLLTASTINLNCGICLSSSGAGNTVTKCCVKNINANTAGATDVQVCGIYLSATTGGTITKCHVSGLKMSSSSATSVNYGIGVFAGGWNIYNNVVLMDNGADGHSPLLRALYYNGNAAGNIYHNSIKVYGAATSGTAYSAALDLNAGAGVVIKNNIFQNVRSGGSGIKYAVYSNSATAGTYDYNYLETTAAPIANWQGTDENTIALWRTASGASANEINGTITLENVFGYSSTVTIKNKGVNLFATVPDDKNTNPRSTPSPWIGAWEGINPLPIELLSFISYCNEGKVRLTWTTATETNNDYFTILRSQDGIDFVPLTVIKGAGNSSRMLSYFFSDEDPLTGTSYYKLKQTDFDGKYSCSFIIAAAQNQCGVKDVLFPNPTGGSFTIRLNGQNNKRLLVVILDMLGREVYNSVVNMEDVSGSDRVVITPGENIPFGIYYVVASSDTQIIKHKLMLTK
jgi:hypothetical protein